jgi:hypothetical protein
MTPAMIKATVDLCWYFEVGVCAFERSTAGYMLERAEMYSTRGTRRSGPITAQPIRETKSRNGTEPDDAVLVKYGAVSRRLARVGLADPQAARALGAAFGPEGAKYARHERGRCVAIFPLVEHGRALVKRSRDRAYLYLRPHAIGPLTRKEDQWRTEALQRLSDADRLRVEVELDTITRGKDKERRALITLATREATELLNHALSLWVRHGMRVVA